MGIMHASVLGRLLVFAYLEGYPRFRNAILYTEAYSSFRNVI
jgi:hypothetical protein